MFRNFPHFFRNFPQFFHNRFFLVHLACLLVPCVSPLQKCCSLRLREVLLLHRIFSAISRNFSQLDSTLPPPPPRPRM